MFLNYMNYDGNMPPATTNPSSVAKSLFNTRTTDDTQNDQSQKPSEAKVTPNTLNRPVRDSLAYVPAKVVPKKRKQRTTKKDYQATTGSQKQAKTNEFVSHGPLFRGVHFPSEAMVPSFMYETIVPDMKLLHDDILNRGSRLCSGFPCGQVLFAF